MLAACLALPAALTVIGVTGLEAWRVVSPDSHLFVAPPVASLAEAIATDDVKQAYGFIRSGQNPNEPILVSDPRLTGGQATRVHPVVWAVASDAVQSLPMLLGFGARLDPPTQQRAVCIAAQYGREDMVALLELYGGPCRTSFSLFPLSSSP